MRWERHRYRPGIKCYLKVIRVYLASQRWREIQGNISYTMSNYANLWHTIEIYSKSWEISFYFLQRWNFGAFDISIWILLTHNYSLFLIFEQRQRVLFRFCILNWNTQNTFTYLCNFKFHFVDWTGNFCVPFNFLMLVVCLTKIVTLNGQR